MGKYCLTKNLAAKFTTRLKNGDIDPATLAKMTSKERNKFFSDFLGSENARNVNSLFEKKLLQVNKKNAMLNWVKETTGIKPEVKRDLFTRIEKMSKEPSILSPEMEDLFMQDLASTKLGIGVSFEESKKIADLTNKMVDLRAKANPKTFEFKNKSDELKYGAAKVSMIDYVRDLKSKKGQGWKAEYFSSKSDALNTVAGTLKSSKASMDVSLMFRQGLKVLFTKPSIWVKGVKQKLGAIGRELKGVDGTTLIRADAHARPNALNGNYQRFKIDMDVIEEAHPTSIPGKIPGLGRLFKASESAYAGAALRMRVDLADFFIDRAKKQGIDITDNFEAESIGKLVNSMTGRGSIGKLGAIGKELNVALFSPKFFKSNLDFLTAHSFAGKKISNFAKREARKNLYKAGLSVTTIVGLANFLYPGSTELDPRSSNWGKIKIGNTRFDVTGGMGSLITLASRVVPTKHNGKFGSFTKSGSTDKFTKLSTGGYGGRTALDAVHDFAENKLSPLAGVLRDYLKGERFGGEKQTPMGVILGSTVPISIETWQELRKDPDSANIWGAMLAEMTGISTGNYPSSQARWERSTGKELLQFKEKVGVLKFKKANEEYNLLVSRRIEELKKDDKYKNMSDEDKGDTLTKMKANKKQEIYDKYNFKYKRAEKSKTPTTEEKLIKKLSE